MPLPSPQKNQSEKEFVGSCMSSQVMQKEYSNDKQRLAVCFSIYRRSKKSKATKDDSINWKDYEDSPAIII